MSIDPKILEQRRTLLPAGGSISVLRGTPKQIKWATTIRNDALSLTWPDDVRGILCKIVDATWWIANKTITTTLKFKPPAPEQLVDSPPTSGSTQPELARSPIPATPAATVSRSPHEKRVDDALQWAESVSRHPTLAQAAILSCLRFAYPKGAMRDRITAKGRELLAQANHEVGRDTDAIQLMLSKE